MPRPTQQSLVALVALAWLVHSAAWAQPNEARQGSATVDWKAHVDLAVEPSEGTWEGGEIVRISSSGFEFSEPPYMVTLAGVEQSVVSVTTQEIVVRTTRPEAVTCAPRSGPTEIFEATTGVRLSGPEWTYQPPGRCLPLPALCEPLGSRLCLHDDRFGLEVDWTDFAGNSGPGRLALSSESSGLFWFFSSDNWEMHAKLLKGCVGNDRYWLFSAASTTVAFDLRVTDYLGGTTKVYSNELGSVAVPDTDTSAFPCLDPAAMVFEVNSRFLPPEGGESLLLATVVDAQGIGVPGVVVAFESELGTFQPGTAGAAETVPSGQALEILTVTEEDIVGLSGDTFDVRATVLIGGQPATSTLTVQIVR